jgi:hypothetical protein
MSDYHTYLKTIIDTKRFETLHSLIAGMFGQFIAFSTGGFIKPGRTASTILLWVLSLTSLVSLHIWETYDEFLEFVLQEYAQETLLVGLWAYIDYYQGQLWLWGAGAGLIMMLAAGYQADLFFKSLSHSVIDAVEQQDHLIDLKLWLCKVFTIKRQVTFCLTFAVIMTTITVILLYAEQEVTYASVVLIFITWFQGALGWYITIPSLGIIKKLQTYKLKVFVFDPSQTQFVQALSDNLLKALIVGGSIGFYFTIGVVGLELLEVFYKQVVFLILFAWGPIIYVFVMYHLLLNRIIKDSKNALLGQIQPTITVEHWQNENSTAALEKQLSQLDIHNRISQTPDSAIQLNHSLLFLNSLIIPLMGLALPWLTKPQIHIESLKPEKNRASIHQPFIIAVKMQNQNNKQLAYQYQSSWGKVTAHGSTAVWRVPEQTIPPFDGIKSAFVEITATVESINKSNHTTLSHSFLVNQTPNIQIKSRPLDETGKIHALSIEGGKDPDGDKIKLKWQASHGKLSQTNASTVYLNLKGVKASQIIINCVADDGWDSWSLAEFTLLTPSKSE